MLTTNGSQHQLDRVAKGSFWKGVALALMCHFGYLLFVSELPLREVRVLGYMLLALVQFAYLFPLAIFYKKRDQGRTSNGLMIAGVLSLLSVAAWFAYSVLHGNIPLITRN